ncbi:MAG: DUF2069 domain-containing protein [Pseudomonadota bacterium]
MTESVSTPIAPNTAKSLKLAGLSYVILIVVIAFNLLFVHSFDNARLQMISLAIWLLPLIFPLRGIIRGNPYTFAWGNFIVSIYICRAAMNLYLEPSIWFAHLIELLLSSATFIGGTYYARWRGIELGLELKKPSKHE